MNKYLILTFNVCNMGGGQLFVLRRAKHLKTRGYDVSIVVTYHSDYYPLEEEFSEFQLYVIPEMGVRSAMFYEKETTAIIDDLLEKLGHPQDLLIESHTLTTIEWGELLAARCGARHLAFPLADHPISDYKTQPGKTIFEDKLNRNEFYGCNSMCLKLVFNRDNVPSNYVNVGYDESEMVDTCIPRLQFAKNSDDYVISTVTRLDKTYIEPLVEGVYQLAKKYSSQKFVLLIAGGSKTPGRERYLKENYGNNNYSLENLNIIYTGYIEKLGKDLFFLTDVFVGMATASINAISQKCLTINIDPRNGMQYASGFFGTDTKNFAFSENEEFFPIITKLEEAYLFSQERIRSICESGRCLFEKEFSQPVCFEKLDKLFDGIKPSFYNISYKVPIYYTISIKLFIAVRNFFSKFRHTIKLCVFKGGASSC